jgi:mannose-6-phosphate isomerase-like protein (cupin superfamily)
MAGEFRPRCVLVAILLAGVPLAAASEPPRSFVQRESDIAVVQPGPHDGDGNTTAFPFFEAEPGLGFVFRKRLLHPGASIGLHRNDKDEIYYIASGRGLLQLEDEVREVGPGDAVLTRRGHRHGLRQRGDVDLVIFVIFPLPAADPLP